MSVPPQSAFLHLISHLHHTNIPSQFAPLHSSSCPCWWPLLSPLGSSSPPLPACIDVVSSQPTSQLQCSIEGCRPNHRFADLLLKSYRHPPVPHDFADVVPRRSYSPHPCSYFLVQPSLLEDPAPNVFEGCSLLQCLAVYSNG